MKRERHVILGLGVAPRTHLDLNVLFVHLFSFCHEEGFVCARVSSIIHCGCSEGGKRMFYACLNMHLKSKGISNDSENAKGFHQRLLIHDALRKATYFRANPCYHWRSSPTEVIFHLRTCALMTVWGAATGTEIQTPCSQHMKYQSREEEGSPPYNLRTVR